MNRELFQKIHNVISVSPEKLDMTSWEETEPESGCGTTRCVAGWAVFLAADGPIFGTGDDGPIYTDRVHDLAESMGVDSETISVPLLAERLLGLDGETADRVFYRFDNRLMAKYVEAAAQGDTDRCNEILGV